MIDASTFALLERIHGHLAVLALVVLVHPLLSLGRGKVLRRGTLVAAVAGLALLLPAFALGWTLYPEWRTHVKARLLIESPGAAQAFEVKEHLAWFALALAVAATGALIASGRLPEGRRLARWLLGACLACGLTSAVLGLFVGGATWPAWPAP